ncbi:MAG: hypothetical protein M3539_11935 [Acidobacteriota bacterium]|nr:hypothetical protein [Acidobacteriota bacterium]
MKDGEGLSCGQESELVSFLYGELNEADTRTFRGHMNGCASCSEQLAAFANVRESVGAWRNETLGGVTSFAEQAAVSRDYRRPSALLALREFFNLSPAWMKGAVAFASLLFCLLAVLVVARFREMPTAPIVATPSNQSRSTQEFNAAVERRVQDELKRIQDEAATNSSLVSTLPADRNAGRGKANRGSEVVSGSNLPKARRPLTKVEREELAADLRLISGVNDGDLELLADGINQ